MSFTLDCEVSVTPEIAVKVTKVSKKDKDKVEKKEKIEKERINGLIPKKLVDAVKQIVLWHPEVTMTELLTKGLEYIVDQYGPLEHKDGKLKVGRRPKMSTPTEVEQPNVIDQLKIEEQPKVEVTHIVIEHPIVEQPTAIEEVKTSVEELVTVWWTYT